MTKFLKMEMSQFAIRRAEVWRVEGVQTLGAELRSEALIDDEVLENGNVPVCHSRTLKRYGTGYVPIGKSWGGGEGGGVDPPREPLAEIAGGGRRSPRRVGALAGAAEI